MFKALFLGYLFGVRSERQLVREIEVNVAYRWFLRLRLTDGVFDASTLSQNRRRRFNDTSVAQDIFDAIVEQAIQHGLVDLLRHIGDADRRVDGKLQISPDIGDGNRRHFRRHAALRRT